MGVYAEGAFRRDWRETRVALDGPYSAYSSVAQGEGGGCGEPAPLSALINSGGFVLRHTHGGGGIPQRLSSRHRSPAFSARSAKSVRQRPAHPLSRLSVSTAGEVIDVDAFDGGGTSAGTGTGTGSGSSAAAHKRKAAAMSTIVEDDEIEFVEGPVPAAAASSTAARARAGKTTKKRR